MLGLDVVCEDPDIELLVIDEFVDELAVALAVFETVVVETLLVSTVV